MRRPKAIRVYEEAQACEEEGEPVCAGFAPTLYEKATLYFRNDASGFHPLTLVYILIGHSMIMWYSQYKSVQSLSCIEHEGHFFQLLVMDRRNP